MLKRYLFDKEQLFALVTALETDSIIAIIGLHKKLFFNSGIHVGMSVKEIVSLYHKCVVEQNLMMYWEEIYDDKNNFTFVFKTDDTNRIGNYIEFDVQTKPINLSPLVNWITII